MWTVVDWYSYHTSAAGASSTSAAMLVPTRVLRRRRSLTVGHSRVHDRPVTVPRQVSFGRVMVHASTAAALLLNPDGGAALGQLVSMGEIRTK